MWPWERFKMDRFVISSGHYQIHILEANSDGHVEKKRHKGVVKIKAEKPVGRLLQSSNMRISRRGD